MSSTANEITLKLRNDIKLKLTEIGAYVDNELPDYIMVMVANQKSRYQMKDDLSLFLGKNTDEFVDWLHEALKNMQSKVAAASTASAAAAPAAESQSDGDKKKSKSVKGSTAIDVTSKKERGRKKRKSSESKSSDVHAGEEAARDSNLEEKSQDDRRRQSTHSRSGDEKAAAKDHGKEEKESADKLLKDGNESRLVSHEEQEVILQLNADNGEGDELLQETIENTDTQNKCSESRGKLNGAIPASSPKKEISSKLTTRLPSSTVGAIVTHEAQFQDEDEDEPYDPSNGRSLSSIIRISERRISVPPERQANKLLILRAMREAHKSVTSPLLKRKCSEDGYTPTPIVKKFKENVNVQQEYNLDPDDLRHYLQSNRQQDTEAHYSSQVSEKLSSAEVTMKSVQKERRVTSPKFIVTLDGIKNHLSVGAFSKDVLAGDELVLDEEVDEEFAEGEESDAQADAKMDDLENENSSKQTEKCKYWPSCKNGDKCVFHHPSVPCKTFPNCRYGDKCLYIHPSCKYDAMCAKSDCPFAHSSKRVPMPPFKSASASLSHTPCKYYPNCINPACPYLHPKPCAYGAKCRNPHCSFTHPTSHYCASLPRRHQLKWKAKEHISDRKFVAQEAVEAAKESSSSSA